QALSLEREHALARIETRGERRLECARLFAWFGGIHRHTLFLYRRPRANRRAIEKSLQPKGPDLVAIGHTPDHVSDEFTGARANAEAMSAESAGNQQTVVSVDLRDHRKYVGRRLDDP